MKQTNDDKQQSAKMQTQIKATIEKYGTQFPTGLNVKQAIEAGWL